VSYRVDDIKPQWKNAFRLKYNAGIVVIEISSDSPAAEAGIHSGDVIKEEINAGAIIEI
jgi:S1-C subfamily serine protease